MQTTDNRRVKTLKCITVKNDFRMENKLPENCNICKIGIDSLYKPNNHGHLASLVIPYKNCKIL